MRFKAYPAWLFATIGCFAALARPLGAQPKQEYSIEGLLRDGWSIAGYVGTFDSRSTVILFRHTSETYLVQCSTIYDVTRTPRTFTNCYALR